MDEPVLIVDDNEMNREILEEILDDHFDLITAENGQEALACYHEHHPGLVLMDIMMPGMDGYEACRQLKTYKHEHFTQVILVSAKASSEERVKGYEAGADDYVIKPFDEDELLAKVQVQVRLRDALVDLSKARSAIADDNTRLTEVVADQTQELVSKRDMIVFALANLADSRDPETGEHLQRIREYCKVLSSHLSENGPYADQIDQDFIDSIYLASPLHDIGKVGIPDAILLKPGRLTDGEFEIMKHHANLGSTALNEVAQHGEKGLFLRMAIDIAQSHHERWDGHGYPDGLGGLDIPLAARITTVADVFDALTSVRVYKKAFTTEVAKSMIVSDAGTHFDPTIIEAFSACYEQLADIRQRLDGSQPAEQTQQPPMNRAA